MDGLKNVLCEVKQVRERQMLYDITYTWNLKEQNKNRLIDTYNKLMAARGEVWEGS